MKATDSDDIEFEVDELARAFRGFSLVEAVVSIAILSLLIGFVASLSEFARRESSTDEILGQGIRVGVFVADELRSLGFSELLKKCVAENVMNARPANLSCLNASGDQITRSAAITSLDEIPLKIRVNASAEADENGRHCVEMTSCRLVGDGHLLAVNLITSWIGPDSKPKSTLHQFRVIR